MVWPFQSSQPDPPPASAKKRVSFAPGQPTTCPQPQMNKHVRFTPDTKPGSRSDSRSARAESSKTRWPSPCPAPPGVKQGAPGLSSVKRHFATTKPASKPTRPAPRVSTRPPPRPEPPKVSRPRSRPQKKPELAKASRPSSKGPKPDATVSIPVHGESYNGPPKARHQRPGYEWVSYEVRVWPTGKDWRGEQWAK